MASIIRTGDDTIAVRMTNGTVNTYPRSAVSYSNPETGDTVMVLTEGEKVTIIPTAEDNDDAPISSAKGLITCPRCGSLISGQERKCPNCGFVLKRSSLLWYITLTAAIIIILFILLF